MAAPVPHGWMRCLAGAFLMLAAAPAHAYCVLNELRDRSVTVEQERHPDSLREERRLKATLKPGTRVCCPFHKLDCNPGGRNNSVVNLDIRIAGEPEYICGFPPGAEPNVKVTGAGTIRILRNPRTRSAFPYVVRVRTQDKDLTGPRGIACTEPKPKGNK